MAASVDMFSPSASVPVSPFNFSSPESPSIHSFVCKGMKLQAGHSNNYDVLAGLSCMKIGSRMSGDGVAKAVVLSGGEEVLSRPGDVSSIDVAVNSSNLGLQPDEVAFGSLSTATSLISSTFPVEDADHDLDFPTAGFASIPEAVEDMVLVVDDEDRENKGDLIMAAEMAIPEAMAFIVKHGAGIICASMKEEDLERLQLPMVNQKDNEEKLKTAFTVTVDAKNGTTTGVSARDRATTILALASRDSKPEDFNRPGDIFPLKYHEGGVLKRAGHKEASIDLAVLAGLSPAAVLCEVVDDDGSMARLPRLLKFVEKENLKIISIANLISYIAIA